MGKSRFIILLILLITLCQITIAQIPSVQSYSTATSNGSTNLVTIPKPPGLAIGDLMFAQCGANTCGYMTCRSPGWTSIIENNWACQSSITFLGCLYKIADVADVAATDFTFTFSVGPQTNSGIILRIRGFNPINVISSSAQTYVTSISNPSFNNTVTPARANSLYLMSATDGLGNTITNPTIAISNPTWITSLPQNSLRTLFYATRSQVTATGASSFTAPYSNWLCQMIIIAPYCPLGSLIMDTSTCNSYTLNGVTYDSSGTYSQTLTNLIGCDSIITLNLIVKPKSFSTITQSICEGSSFFGYNATGVYIDTLTAANSCDSIRTLNLTVKKKLFSTINQSICQGQSYLGYNAAGIYIDTLVTANGCDSIRTLDLTVKPRSFSNFKEIICKGDSGYTVSGIYFDTLTASNGCDSIRVKELLVLNDCEVFPSAFTPNNDGKNDVFRISNVNNLTNYLLLIYNRYGQKVFETKDPKTGWNGFYNGILQPPGVYVWFSSFNKAGFSKIKKGAVLLIR